MKNNLIKKLTLILLSGTVATTVAATAGCNADDGWEAYCTLEQRLQEESGIDDLGMMKRTRLDCLQTNYGNFVTISTYYRYNDGYKYKFVYNISDDDYLLISSYSENSSSFNVDLNWEYRYKKGALLINRLVNVVDNYDPYNITVDGVSIINNNLLQM